MADVIQRVYVPTWRDEHRTTKYPFSDRATLVSSGGQFLPENLFLDAIFYPPGGESGGYLSAVTIRGGRVRLSVGDTTSEERCWAEFSLESPPAESLLFRDTVDRVVGLAVPGENGLTAFASWAEGIHTFLPEATEWALTCWVPTPESGVRGVLLDDGTLLSGDVWLVGERGIVLTPETVLEVNSDGESEVFHVVRVDIVGDPLFPQRQCAGDQVPHLLRKMTVVTRNGPTEIYPFRGALTLTTWPLYRMRPALRLRAAEQGLVVELAAASDFFPFIA